MHASISVNQNYTLNKMLKHMIRTLGVRNQNATGKKVNLNNNWIEIITQNLKNSKFRKVLKFFDN